MPLHSVDRHRPGRGHRVRLCCLLSCLLLLLALSGASAQAAVAVPEPPGPDAPAEAWLVTYGPGEIYWQRFGHNAIWIRDPARRLDHVFNFGFFDFGQERFLLRFLLGRMLYFSAARPAQEEFGDYVVENRSIRIQRLDLESGQIERLTEFLVNEVRPENRNYLYDYYENNCSTRVRDAIDLAIGGSLSAQYRYLPGELTRRDHTRRLTLPDPLLYLGLEIVLGAPVDAPASMWDEMFIPALLAAGAGALDVGSPAGPRPLVTDDRIIFRSSLPAPADAPVRTWPRYLAYSLGLIAIAWLLTRLAGSNSAVLLARTWLVLAGVAGLALVFFWLGTDHGVASLNMNLLVLNPLWLWLAAWRRGSPGVLPIVAGMSVLAAVMPWFPPQQYTQDVLAAFLPLNLAAAAVLGRRRI
jgi:hypothetical protein